MSQNFTSGVPAIDAAALSTPERQNWEAVLSNHSGVVLPAYAVEGMSFFDDATRQLHIAKAYGSKAFADYLMGPTIKLFIALTGAGQDGNLFDTDVRLQDNTLLGVDPKFWDLMAFSPDGGILSVFFNRDFPPSFFAGQKWNDPVIGEPILWVPDGNLRNKNWETIPPGMNELIYSGSPSPLSNILPFADTELRAINVEDRQIRLSFPTSFAGADHVTLQLPISWFENQDDKLEFDLFVNGAKRATNRFKAVPFLIGGVPYVIVYLLSGVTAQLEAFIDGREYELTIRKNL